MRATFRQAKTLDEPLETALGGKGKACAHLRLEASRFPTGPKSRAVQRRSVFRRETRIANESVCRSSSAILPGRCRRPRQQKLAGAHWKQRRCVCRQETKPEVRLRRGQR